MKLSRYNQFILKESKNNIDSICKKYGIENYTINEDGSIDVDGNIWISETKLTKLPLKFNKVSGDFYCGDNKLISLEGCPEYVGGYFDCTKNKLSSLEGGPNSVDGSFFCYNNKLTSLKGCPSLVGPWLSCFANNLTSLEGFPEDYEGRVFINENPVHQIVSLFPKEKVNKAIFWINEFDVIRKGKEVSLDRLEEVFIQMNLEIPENIQFKSYKII